MSDPTFGSTEPTATEYVENSAISSAMHEASHDEDSDHSSYIASNAGKQAQSSDHQNSYN